MKRLIPALFAGLLMLTGCAAPSAGAESYHRITMQEAIDMMSAETGYIILDVRTAEEYAAGHIPGAINIPNESIGTSAPPTLPDKDQLILVYCRSGNRSRQASAKLAALGYTRVTEFGGISAWPGDIVTN